ncbi:MAG TPA: hypothetical protein VFC31_04915 [Candidatus Limnocylindria bacterium]|nr:hypothetical protein [Candidatus Limnocylindria bacterium]
MATTTALPVRSLDHSLDTAYRALWVAAACDLLAFGVGFSWDRMWHTQHPFEDFFSPPHLFIYTMHLGATLTLAYVALTPSLRAHFGDAFALPPLPFPVPGPIAIAGGGFVVTALAGVFDGTWHTAFGLDETGWSLPHSMLGAGIFVAFVGIVACRWALRDRRPIGWPSAIVFGFLLIATAGERFTGPIGTNLTRDFIELVASIPVLAAEPAFQHTARIYLAYDLDRMNPLFVPLASLSAGAALSLVRHLDPRPLLMLGLTLVATRTSELVPFLAPGIALALNGRRRVSTVGWVVAGAAFATATALIWKDAPGSALLGAALFPIGARIGDAIWGMVEHPARGAVLAFVTLFGLAYPALTGIVDLALRARTP